MSLPLLLLLVAGPAASDAAEPAEPVEDEAIAEPGTDEATLPEPPALPEPPGPSESSVELEPPPVPVRWSAPAGCPTPEDVQQGIERRLGRPLADDELRLEATVSEVPGGYRLALRTEAAGAVRERAIDSEDCAALADAAALIAALAVDPVAVAGVVDLEPEASPTAEPRPARAPPRPSRRGPGGVMRLAGGVGLGALPGVTGGAALAGGLRWPRARLEVEGGYWIPRRSDAIDGERVRVQLGTAGVRGCGQLSRDRLEAPLCGGLQLGGLRGDGPGDRSTQGLWLAVEAGVGLTWWASTHWGLGGGFSAAVPLVHPDFDGVADPEVRLFEPSAVAGRLWLGVELRLGGPR